MSGVGRKDVFGVEVEVGDIVLSCPKHKWSSGPEVGKVVGVFNSGRVTIQIPEKVPVYAYQEGAPDVETQGTRWVRDESAVPDSWGRKPYKTETYTYMRKDYTVVRTEWKWVRKQAADITLIVLKKDGQDVRDAGEASGFTDLTRNLNLDYSTEKPEIA